MRLDFANQLVWFYTTTTVGFPFYTLEQDPPNISSPYPFLSASRSRSRTSKTPSRPTKNKINFWSPNSLFSYKKIQHRCLTAKTSAIGLPTLFSQHTPVAVTNVQHSKQSKKELMIRPFDIPKLSFYHSRTYPPQKYLPAIIRLFHQFARPIQNTNSYDSLSPIQLCSIKILFK